MSIDILNIEPHQVSRDLKGYSILLYGDPKTGKTTISSRFPNSLLLAFEKGYSALPGVLAAPLDSWTDMLRVAKQLETDEARAKYDTLVLDTADLAYDSVESYICSLHGVDSIGDIPYGKGYQEASKEFDKILQRLRKLGYGIVLISHAQDRTITDEQGKEFQRITPTLANTPRKIVNRFVDIIGYARIIRVTGSEEGTMEEKTYLYMRATIRFEAGSRFPYTPRYIEFTYDNLVDAIVNAIEQQEQELQGSVVDNKEESDIMTTEMPSYDDIMEKFKTITNELIAMDETNKRKIQVAIENRIGKGKRVSELDPRAENIGIIELIIEDLEEIRQQ